MSFDGFSERLRNVLDEGKYTQKEAAEKINISEHSFTKYLNGRIPQAKILYKIALLYDKTMEWFLTGKDPMTSTCEFYDNLTEEEKEELNLFIDFLRYKRSINSQDTNDDAKIFSLANETSDISTVEKELVTYIPVIGDIATGISIESIEAYKGDISNSFIIRARGENMIDADIEDGDLVIFKVQPMVENGEIALVNVNGKATIKYIYFNGEECELRSANPEYPPMKYPMDEVNIIGKFVEVLEHK